MAGRQWFSLLYVETMTTVGGVGVRFHPLGSVPQFIIRLRGRDHDRVLLQYVCSPTVSIIIFHVIVTDQYITIYYYYINLWPQSRLISRSLFLRSICSLLRLFLHGAHLFLFDRWRLEACVRNNWRCSPSPWFAGLIDPLLHSEGRTDVTATRTLRMEVIGDVSAEGEPVLDRVRPYGGWME